MITYLKLKNFMSFKEIEFNFKRTEKDVKNLVAIYGENDIGKTNFVKAFSFLKDSIDALVQKITFDDLSNMSVAAVNEINIKRLFDYMPMILKYARTIDCNDLTEIEYGFEINGNEGYYLLKFDDSIKYEKLYYKINVNKGIIFEIKNNNSQINSDLNNNVFISKDYKEEVFSQIQRFWGKYTLLAILKKERKEKNKTFINNNLNKTIFEVIDYFDSINVYTNDKINAENGTSISEGIIAKKQVKKLDSYEEFLREFFIQIYSNVVDVYYKREEKEKDLIKYTLFFRKRMSSKLIDIEYRNESTGTKKLLKEFDSILGVLDGKTEIVDEIDSNIHDLLMNAIINSLQDEITGQLIFTTHNTLLMETLDKTNIYVIVSDYEDNKEANCIADYDYKVQKNNSIRNLYLKGFFGGVPSINDIDFSVIKEEIESDKLKGEDDGSKED